ncbi:MAG: signal recognition particle receptor subunit alpha, partial [Treponema sp.]|nr:signal recognition particle receptor subunit alpha [Treponema sp.]
MKLSFAEKIKQLFTQHKSLDDSFFDDMIDSLIEGDIGAATAVALVDELQKECKEEHISDNDMVLLRMKEK